MSRAAQEPVWLFDLDNTLHNASAHIFPHINRSMTAYLQEHLGVSQDEANLLRVRYWKQYGATLTGLVRHHGTDPRHFLDITHRFEHLHRLMVFDRALRSLLRKLPGRKIVFSNGPQRYANAVIDAMGIRRHFDAVCGIEQMRFHPKPEVKAFRHLLQDHRLNPRHCILIEDSAENLKTAKRLGMKTVLVGRRAKAPPFVDMRLASILDLRRRFARVLPR